MQKIGLEAILRMGSFSRGVKQYTQGITGMEKSTKKGASGLKGLDDQLSPLSGGFMNMIPGIAGVTGAFIALNKVLEFGREGAAIAQTEESFNSLMASMGVAPDILQQMADATLNTVDDMTLMSSTMTLLAGTSEELGGAIVDNAPQLLQIAKAANKLNPSLGTTSFLYQSLATGIKRNSPLLLDNLGLVVKVGVANAVMAQKLDKNVEALTAEEKQMALLEATMRAGDRMIDQVGGSVEAMGDRFAEADVKIKNATDTLKKKFFPVIAEIVGGTVDAVEAGNLLADTQVALAVAVGEAAVAFAKGEDADEKFLKSMRKGIGLYPKMRQEFARLTGGINAFSEAMDPYQEMMLQAARATEELGDAQYEATITTDDLAKAQKALDAVIKDIQKRYESFFGSLAQGIVKHRELGKAQAKSSKDYAATLADLDKQAGKAYSNIKDNFKASLPDATTVAERMGMAGDAWDEWALRIEDVIQNGVASPWYQALQDMGYQKPPDVGLTEWLTGLKTKFYEGRLPDLLPPEWAENVKTQQEAATATVQAEAAKRRAVAKAERDAELAAEKAARDQATLELALTLAEQSGMLRAWSEQRFGPDFAQVGDTAKEVLGLLESGMLDIDSVLQGIITDSVAGVQTALDTTGQQAEETKSLLEEILDKDWASERQSTMATLGQVIEDEISDEPFTPMLRNFEGTSQSIINGAVAMGLDLESEFTEIDLNWAAMVESQVLSWDKGMTKVQKAIQDKVIEKLDEIPTKIVVTVTTEQEGGTEGKQHGGPVQGGVPYVVGEAGPELFVPAQPGTILPSMATDWGMNLPAMGGAAAGGSAFGPTINLTMNPTINNGMDLAEFQALTLQTVERAIGGT